MSPSIHSVTRRAVGIAGRLRGIAQEAILDGVFPWGGPHPASFKAWTRRKTGRPDGDFPSAWRLREDLPFAQPSKVVAVVHVYYPELITEVIEHLRNVPVDFDVLVTNASNAVVVAEDFQVGNAVNVAVLEVDNRGRDIFPLVQLVNAGYLDPYEMVLKLHTKKSEWRGDHSTLSGDGAQWKDQFLSALVGSEEATGKILDAFASNPDLGCVTAPGNVLDDKEYWGGDQHLVTELAKRLELPVGTDDLIFAAGSMYWIRAFLIQGLRGLELTAADFEEEAGQIDATTAHALERLIGILTVESGLKLADTDNLVGKSVGEEGAWQKYRPSYVVPPAARFIPFYLPQFHPSDKNDVWWGKGFTEWTNVSHAKPVFMGHRQPFLPGELGFYDLRFDDVREAQADLSRYAGLDGFMYYYYWFAGDRILNLPIEALRHQRELRQPYCVMWANENWTRAWDGRTKDVLIGQDYDKVPAEDFINDIEEFLTDERYIRVDGKALIAVYRPAQMKNVAQVVRTWRERAREMGVGELFILSVNVAEEFDGLGQDVGRFGFDGSLAFPPHALIWKPAPSHKLGLDSRFRGNVISYAATADAAIEKAWNADTTYFPGVMVGFDNTARRQWRSDVWWGSNPYTFHRWLREATKSVMSRPAEQRLVFINAWNEWAESAVLEPTQRWGLTYLQAVRSVAFS